MSEKKQYPSFMVAGYECTPEFIRAEPEDRYGWKKDHLLVWMGFKPCVGSVISTGVEIPIRKYDRESLMAAIKEVTTARIGQLLNEQRVERKARAEMETRKADLDIYAEGIGSLLEVGSDKTS